MNLNFKPEPEPGTNTEISSSGFESNDVRRVFIRKGTSFNSNDLKKTCFGDAWSPVIHSFCTKNYFILQMESKKVQNWSKVYFMLGIMLSITAGVICICLLVEPINVSSRKNNFRINKKFKQMHLNDRLFKDTMVILKFCPNQAFFD